MRYVLTPDENRPQQHQQETWQQGYSANDEATTDGADDGHRARPPRLKTDWNKVYEALGVLEIILRLVVPCAGLCALWPVLCWVDSAPSGDDGSALWFRMQIAFIGYALVGLECIFGWLSSLIWQALVFVANRLEEREQQDE